MDTVGFTDYKEHVDVHGAIVQHPKYGGDEGDSCHHDYFYHLGCQLVKMKPFSELQPTLYFPHDYVNLCRHFKATRLWIREFDRGSRDQYNNPICFYALLGGYLRAPLRAIWDLIIVKRKGFFTNTKKNGVLVTPDKCPDFMSPELLAVFLRGLIGWWSVIPNHVLDVFSLLGTLHWRWFREASDNDICNHLAIVAVGRERYPTLFSWLAWKWLDKPATIKKLKQYWDWPGYAKPGEVCKDAWFIALPWIKYIEGEK